MLVLGEVRWALGLDRSMMASCTGCLDEWAEDEEEEEAELDDEDNEADGDGGDLNCFFCLLPSN